MKGFTRRTLLTRLAGALLSTPYFGHAVKAVVPAARYGPVTVARWQALSHRGIHLHVFYRGEDVTLRCAFADDTHEGMAELFLLNVRGEKYLWPGAAGEYGTFPGEQEVAKEIVYGVAIRAGAPFA